MGSYVAHNEDDVRKMMSAIGVSSTEELYADVPESMLLKSLEGIPEGLSEAEVTGKIEDVSSENEVFPVIFRGAGAYKHYIPKIVSQIVSKESFLTAYTPYQAEISQGVLQSIFEYQTIICQLTGMDVSNASVYDGATAAAEAAAMCRDKKRSRILVSGAVNPQTVEVMGTYGWAADAKPEILPVKEGRTDIEALKALLSENAEGVAAVFVQQPNYYGQLESCEEIAEAVHEAGGKLVMIVEPISAVILKSAGECGADIAVGEGQPLGMPLSYGGPYLGFMAAKQELMRKLPGRIVGRTKDHEGRDAYVLTLQAREQHIRREKASSNICSNEALCAMTASVYCAAMGASGLKDVAEQCLSKAHYLAKRLESIPGVSIRYKGEFFNEFVTDQNSDPKALEAALRAEGILGGLPLEDGGMLWCATEVNTAKDIERLAETVEKEVGAV